MNLAHDGGFGRDGAGGVSGAVHRVLLVSLVIVAPAIALAAGGFLTGSLQWQEIPADLAAQDDLGEDVAADGETVVVGAHHHDGVGVDSGAAYVYVRDGLGWVQQQKLTASDAAAGDEFGRRVAISADRIVVGAQLDDDDGSASGAAYVFVRNGGVWTEEAKLTASDAAAGDLFGSSVGISGARLVVGAFQDDDGGSASGSAYVFTRSGSVWSEDAKLTASDAAAGDHFGRDVAIQGSRVLVGAWLDSDAGSASGSAYVFQDGPSGWSETQKLVASDGGPGDFFGFRVALGASGAIIGASYDDDVAANSGAAYIYDLTPSGYVEQQKLKASDAGVNDLFGSSVDIDHLAAMVGSPYDGDGGVAKGSVYLFEWDGSSWVETRKEVGADSAPDDEFGWDVSVDVEPEGPVMVVGAPRHDGAGTDAGAVYFIDPDVDDDGLLNEVETDTGSYVSPSDTGTDPIVADTDGDEYIDGDEVAIGSDPFDPLEPFQQQVAAADPVVGASLGRSVAIDDGTLMAGAGRLSGDPGAMYVFTQVAGDWTQQAKLVAFDGDPTPTFGFSVAVAGSAAAAGARWSDEAGSRSGSVYVFERSGVTWMPDVELVGLDTDPDDEFGFSVAMGRGTLVVGAPYWDELGVEYGAAYVFVKGPSGWSEDARLLASDREADDEFGYAVSISGDRIVVGARFEDTGASGAGAAYVFRRDGSVWTQEAKLVSASPDSFDQLGVAIDIDSDTIAVGAIGDDDISSNGGAVYVYARSGTVWSEQAKLTVDSGGLYGVLGTSVTIDGDRLVAGAAPLDGASGGAAWLFERIGTAWNEREQLFAPDFSINHLDGYGRAVDLDGDQLAVGAREKQKVGIVTAGAAYLLDIDRDDDGLLNAVETDTGVFVDAGDTGSDPLSADSDGDGFDDGTEVAAGSDPNDPGSVPATKVPVLSPAALVALAGVLLVLGRRRPIV